MTGIDGLGARVPVGLLAGKVVAVVGAGPGLGRRVAWAAAHAGAAVVVGGRSGSTNAATVAGVEAAGGRALAVACDVTTGTGCRDLAATAVEGFGRLDGLVYTAFHPGGMSVPAVDADLQVWRDTFEVNLFGAVRAAQAAAPALRRAARVDGDATVVLVGSQTGRRVRPGRGDYATSKAALVTLGQVLATELGGDGIRVNTLVPGRMRGPALLDHYRRVAAATGTTLEDQERAIADQLALPRMVTDEEVARSVVYLLSPLAAGVTGQSLDVNAGETLH
jgi:NAD(P)-dependent dehydrogenase (short-subunit alcohol dehydrogenase family)